MHDLRAVEHYRRTYEILCLGLRDSPRPLLTLNPFVSRGDGYVVPVDPATLLRQWRRSEPARDHGAIAKGLGEYRMLRALRMSAKAPVSMPTVSLSLPDRTLTQTIRISSGDADLLVIAARSGCPLLPVRVTGPWLVGALQHDARFFSGFASTAIPQEVSAWRQGVPALDAMTKDLSNLTCNAWISDTAAFVDTAGYGKAIAKVDHLVCAGVLHTPMRHDDPDGIAAELGGSRVEAYQRMKTFRCDPMDLIDRFDAGHRRLMARHIDGAEAGPAQGEVMLNLMVTELGRAIIFDKQCARLVPHLLDKPARDAIDWLACSPTAQSLPMTERLAIAFTRPRRLPGEMRL